MTRTSINMVLHMVGDYPYASLMSQIELGKKIKMK